MAKNHKYIGNGKEKTFPNGGSVINASICLNDLLDAEKLSNLGVTILDILALPPGAANISNTNGKTYLPISVSARTHPSEWGDTHAIYIEEYHMTAGSRTPGQQSAAPKPAQPEAKPDPFGLDADDDVPW